jgi:predicted lipid-binding transport protein (Tim44 family)
MTPQNFRPSATTRSRRHFFVSLVGVVEIGGGLSLAIGLFTRLAELAPNADAIGAIVLLAWYTARSPATSRRSITSSASLAAAEQVNSASPAADADEDQIQQAQRREPAIVPAIRPQSTANPQLSGICPLMEPHRWRSACVRLGGGEPTARSSACRKDVRRPPPPMPTRCERNSAATDHRQPGSGPG